MQQTVRAEEAPDLVRSEVEKIMSELPDTVEEIAPPEPPPSPVVRLLGFIDAEGNEVTEAEVRELNGLDEEALAKTKSTGAALLSILDRATIRVGDQKATADVLNSLLMGDRITLLLGIRKLTWGPGAEFDGIICPECSAEITVALDLDHDIPVRPLGQRVLEVPIRSGIATVTMPDGLTHKALVGADGKTPPELNSILLATCVKMINGMPLLSDLDVKTLPTADRQALVQAIWDANPGPLFGEVKKACPECGAEFPFPITLASLFPL